MKTLILSPRYTEDSISLSNAAVESGWMVERLTSWRAPYYLKNTDVALYGESLFGAVVAEELGLYLLEPKFEWLTKVPSEYKLREVRFSTLAEARKLTQKAFIKPADDKHFKAAIYEVGTDLPSEETLPGTIPILISEPVEWGIEFRFFVLNNHIETFSPYSRYGEVIMTKDGEWLASEPETDKAIKFCQELLQAVGENIPPSVVIDVGEIEGKGWAVVEANSSWASGIYGCNPLNVLKVIARACLPKDRIDIKDRQWVINREHYSS
ncbi:MAG: ATP-grasp domain-containing protein [Acidobacteriota bacterium]